MALTWLRKNRIFAPPFADIDRRPLANSPQARKRARQNEERRLHNAAQRSTLRTSIKDVLKKVHQNNAEEALQAYRRASSLIDRAVRRGHHHKNRAARLKSRLNARVREINVG